MAGPGHQEAKARRQAIRAWDKILTAVETEGRRTRLARADRDAQHRQGQLRRQQEPKQGRARQQQRQEEEHTRRRLASVAEADTEEGSWALALEEGEKTADRKMQGGCTSTRPSVRGTLLCGRRPKRTQQGRRPSRCKRE